MDVSLSKRRETVKDGESWLAAASPWGRRKAVRDRFALQGGTGDLEKRPDYEGESGMQPWIPVAPGEQP